MGITKLNMVSAKPKPVVPDGTYAAICGGYVTEFKVDGKPYQGKSKDYGVRGINIKDVVTVKDGVWNSEVIGLVHPI